MNSVYHQLCLFEKDAKPNYILLSLQENPYSEIKSGEKIYEFRTRYQKISTTAFIYVSQSVKKIMAIIEFDYPIIGSDKEISDLSEKMRSGTYDIMMDYFIRGIGYAIPVKSITEIEPVTLNELRLKFKGFVAPQSYYLLNDKNELLEFLLSREHIYDSNS